MLPTHEMLPVNELMCKLACRVFLALMKTSLTHGLNLIDGCKVLVPKVSKLMYKPVCTDGSRMLLTPEKSIQLQNEIGADIIMALDDVVSSTTTGPRVEEAMHRTIRWIDRCITAHQRPTEQNLFGIVQGGLDLDLRAKCCEVTRMIYVLVSRTFISALGRSPNDLGFCFGSDFDQNAVSPFTACMMIISFVWTISE